MTYLERNEKKILFFFVIFLYLIIDLIFSSVINLKNFYNQKNNIFIKHPVYHHTFKKNSEWTDNYGKYGKYKIFTNSLGFRDFNIREIKKKNYKNHRILFIGDSVTEGVLLDYEKTFAGLIQTKLKKYGYEILNAARVSYSPSIYFIKTKYLLEVEKLKFDELFLFIDISDCQDEGEIYQLKNNIVTYTPQRIDYYKKKEINDKKKLKDLNTFRKIKNFINYNFKNSYRFLNFVYDGLDFNEEEKKKNKFSHEWEYLVSLDYDRDKWTIDKKIYDKYCKFGMTKMIEYVDKLYLLLKKNNIKMSIAVYPLPSQIWYEDLNSIQVKVWKNFSNARDIDFINFFNLFVRQNISDKEKIQILRNYYIPFDIHFNENGNNMIANELEKKFKKLNNLN